MPEDKNCKFPQSPMSECRKKKKKRKKNSPAPEKKEKPVSASLPPETLPVLLMPPQDKGQTPGQLPKPVTSKKKRQQLKGSQKSTKHHKDLQTLFTATHECGDSGALANLAELSIQTRESLRWEGVLQDPQEEAKRLEQYRTNRRQRYIACREGLLKETQHTLKQIFLKDGRL